MGNSFLPPKGMLSRRLLCQQLLVLVVIVIGTALAIPTNITTSELLPSDSVLGVEALSQKSTAAVTTKVIKEKTLLNTQQQQEQHQPQQQQVQHEQQKQQQQQIKPSETRVQEPNFEFLSPFTNLERETIEKHSEIECNLKGIQTKFPEPSEQDSTSVSPFAPDQWEQDYLRVMVSELCNNVSAAASASTLRHADMLTWIESDECRQRAIIEHCQRVDQRVKTEAETHVVYKDTDSVNPSSPIKSRCDAKALEATASQSRHMHDITKCSIHGMVSEHKVISYCSLERSRNTNRTRVAYAILSHRSPTLVARLVSAIYDPFNYYVVHADLARLPVSHVRAAIEKRFCMFKPKGSPANCELPDNVRVISAVAVEWASLSVFDALHATVNELMHMSPPGTSPEWSHVINLSESDYPLHSQQVITKFLGEYGRGVNFLDIHDPANALDEKRWRSRAAHNHCQGRSNSIHFLKAPPNVKFYDGSMWTIMTREFWEEILSGESGQVFRHVYDYAQDLEIPDESMQQTLVMASSHCARVCNVNFRLENWNGGSSPDVFGMEDVNALARSPAFFARKFDENSNPVQAVLDSKIHQRESIGLTLKEWM